MSSPADPGGDFLANMLSDLLRLMPGGAGLPWPFAYQIAASAAIGDAADPNPDPPERIRLEQLSGIAELHVADVTGMKLSPSGQSPELVATSRAEWARRTLDSWKPVLDRLAPIVASGPLPGTPGESPSDLTEDVDGPADELSRLMGRFAGAMMPMMMALQVGSAAGHLARRTIGQYEVPLAPIHGGEILVVSGNLAEAADSWSLPKDDLAVWLCIHEMVYHAVLSRPHVAGRLADLVVAHAEHVRPDPLALQALAEGGDVGDPAAMMAALSDPSAFTTETSSAALQLIRSELDALTATMSGYVEYVTASVANRIIGTHAPIGEAMRRRRLGRGQGEKAAEQLFGLRVDQDQVDRGGRFVEGVLERSGDAELARLWIDESSLPTPAEVDAPGLWLARLEIDDASLGGGSGK
jgi:putative hydrolase